MPKIQIGNSSYFLVLALFVVLFLSAYFLLKNKNKETQYKVLLIWAFVNFALHFVKQLIYLRTEYLYTSTADNICSISTLVLPFVLMMKKESFIKDTVLFLSMLGGIAALIYPTEVIFNSKSLLGEFATAFEPYRFYFCHFTLFSVSLLTCIFDLYRPKMKRFYLIPIGVLLYLTVIFVNTGILCATKMVYYSFFESQLALFWDRNFLNSSFVFGPTDDMGAAGEFFGILCPNFMKVDYLNIGKGYMEYWPVVWMTVPSYVIFTPLYFLLFFPFFILDYKKKKRAQEMTL